jgi:hypothetical protein
MESDEAAWLMSPAARALRKLFLKNQADWLNQLIGAAAVSSDPKMQFLAASYMAWKTAAKEMEIPNESDN